VSQYIADQKDEITRVSRHLIHEVDKLKTQLVALATRVEEALRAAVKSVATRDPRLAAQVIQDDRIIDGIEVDIEEECLKIMALHQPVAIDLRVVVAVLKINNDLERIGDLAVNIAERGESLSRVEYVPSEFDFRAMGEKVQTMLRKSLDSLVNLNETLANEVLVGDDEIDAIHRHTYEQICADIKTQPNRVDYFIQLLAVSRNLERVADHATNIAEDVIYLCEGQIIRHAGVAK
jgi:phosphate transport system protein